MAIWQYFLMVVPEKSIKEDYQCIFKNNKSEFLPDTDSFWKNFEGNIFSIIPELDKIIPKADWGDETYLNWKGNEKNQEDNDACICLSDDQTKIEEFHFRIDLRKTSNITNFLQPILSICKKNQFVLIDLKGNIFKPQLEDILESMKMSNATAFLSDPIKFLDNLSKNNSNEGRT
jgi:hypothetical protein